MIVIHGRTVTSQLSLSGTLLMTSDYIGGPWYGPTLISHSRCQKLKLQMVTRSNCNRLPHTPDSIR